MKQPTSNRRLIIGISVGFIIIAIGALTLYELGKNNQLSLAELSWKTYLLFYSAITTLYLLTILLWSRFCIFACQPRTVRENIIDTGLLAIGKYVPGKILGVAMRGAVQSDTFQIQGRGVKISLVEQLCVLIVGVLLGIFIFTTEHWGYENLAAFSLAVILGSWLTVFLLIRISQQFLNFPKSPAVTTIIFALKQSLGYLLLWLVTSIPILILLWHHYTLQPLQMVQVLLAFTIAMLSGWVAFFAPGGLGVRESSFVLLAPAFMEWQDAASWIVLHRILITIFDITYGLVVSFWLLKTVKKVTI